MIWRRSVLLFLMICMRQLMRWTKIKNLIFFLTCVFQIFSFPGYYFIPEASKSRWPRCYKYGMLGNVFSVRSKTIMQHLFFTERWTAWSEARKKIDAWNQRHKNRTFWFKSYSFTYVYLFKIGAISNCEDNVIRNHIKANINPMVIFKIELTDS